MIPGVLIAFGGGWFAASSKGGSGGKPEVAESKVKRERRVSSARTTNSSSAIDAFDRSGSTRQMVAELTVHLDDSSEEELEDLRKELKGKGWEDWQKTSIAYALLYERWTELDPKAAIEAAGKERMWGRDQHYKVIFEQIAEDDPKAAWAMATEIENSQDRRKAREAALSAIAGHDPAYALERLKENKGIPAGGVFSKWAKSDPEAAFAEAENISGLQRGGIMASIHREWFKKDRDAATEHALALPAYERKLALMAIGQEWAKKEPKEAGAWVAQNMVRFDQGSIQQFAGSLAESDPEFAITWMQEHTEGNVQKRGMGQAWQKWFEKDIEGAVDWLKNLEDKTQVPGIVNESFWMMAYYAPNEAVSLLKQVGEKNVNPWQISRALSEIGKVDIDRALELAGSFKDSEIKKRSMGAVLKDLAK